MFDVVEGLKILNCGQVKYSIEVEEYGRDIEVTILQSVGGNKHRRFIIPGEVVEAGGDEMMFMMHIHKAKNDFFTNYSYQPDFATSFHQPVFKFDGV